MVLFEVLVSETADGDLVVKVLFELVVSIFVFAVFIAVVVLVLTGAEIVVVTVSVILCVVVGLFVWSVAETVNDGMLVVVDIILVLVSGADGDCIFVDFEVAVVLSLFWVEIVVVAVLLIFTVVALEEVVSETGVAAEIAIVEEIVALLLVVDCDGVFVAFDVAVVVL